ncbi:hypothetical protein DAPPUDRAFT_227569 [Daphnia pulex]|uniref:Uncharacterized protein n=1 Tax=Daphnia pulex TaxID=6669 RepID=E9H7H8_DAPPU|nr:hypothetical protein DAPPUDRAFT_227569 [Daphnia pulex]|eukprot:EFX72311.1 hypothetical protein DAPPUDRAFT_227569 [Daphnia pulex]
MSMVIEKIKMQIEKIKPYVSGIDLIVIFVVLFIEWCLYNGVIAHGNSFQDTPVMIKCNDPNINYPSAPQEETDWATKCLFAAGILLFCSMSIGHTISVMKKQDEESQTGIFHGTRKNIPVVLLVRWWSLLIIGLFLVMMYTIEFSYLMEASLSSNFVSACKPANLELKCRPDSMHSVFVYCTTPLDIWLPARSSFPPKFLPLQVFLMLYTFLFIIMNMRWSGAKRYLIAFLTLSCLLLTFGICYTCKGRLQWASIIWNFFVNIIVFGVALLSCIDVLSWDGQGQQKLPTKRNDVPQIN